MNYLEQAKEIDTLTGSPIKYSICTLVSRKEEYAEMLESFVKAGFKHDFCEYLYIDNCKKNKYDAYQGLNLFLEKAKGQYIILCHQDILLNYDNISILETRMQEIDALDSSWALIGNAGAVGIKNPVIVITEPGEKFFRIGKTPRKVQSLDENFMLMKKSANLGFSNDLHGYHLYGTDLCLQARTRGYSAYVVNFNLLHKSKGNPDSNFYALKSKLIQKYTAAFAGRYIQTTITKFYLSGSPFANWFYNSRLMMFLSRKYYKHKFREDRRS